VDVLQAAVLILGATVLTVLGLNAVGGFAGLQSAAPEGFFHMFKPMSDPDFPWTGIIFGAPILGIWYWCTDQYIVQRVLGGKNINHARSGAILAGFLKILPVFILIIPGIIAVVLFNDPTLGDRAYPVLVSSYLLPAGVKGIVIASLLAALISSLASCFNSTSTLFTMDFYSYFRPEATERELVLVGRLATTVLVIMGILWVPLIKYISNQLFIYLQSVQAYISPPIAAVFIIGISWKRVNGKGAVWTLLIGAVIGVFRIVIEVLNNRGMIQNQLLMQFADINYLHFAVFLFLISTGVLVSVSLMSSAPTNGKATSSLDPDQYRIIGPIGRFSYPALSAFYVKG